MHHCNINFVKIYIFKYNTLIMREDVREFNRIESSQNATL